MTDSRDLNKNTFLSRVFGLNSTYDDRHDSHNPLLIDDNYINSLNGSTNNMRDTYYESNEDSNDEEEEDDDEEEDNNINGANRHGVSTRQKRQNLSSSGSSIDTSVPNLLNFQDSQRAEEVNYDDDDGLLQSFAIGKNNNSNHVGMTREVGSIINTKNQLHSQSLRPMTTKTTLHSEDDSDSDSGLDIDLDPEPTNGESSSGEANDDSNGDLDDEEPFDSVIISKPNNDRPSLKKDSDQNVYASQTLEDDYLDNVSESLLFQQNPKKTNIKKKGKSPGILKNNGYNADNSPDNLNSFQNSLRPDQSFSANMIQIGEQARNLASKAMEHMPKGISFQLPSRQAELPMYIPLANRKQPNSKSNTKAPNAMNARSLNDERQLRHKLGILSPKERTLWMWSNISNLDQFLQDVYVYYTGNGYNCIVLKNIYDILIIVFVVSISAFMGNCVDYNLLMHHDVNKLDQVLIPKCYSKTSFSQKFFYFTLIVMLGFKLKSFITYIKDLREIKNFYNLLLDIEDDELQTIGWPIIVQKIMVLRDQNTNALISGVNNTKPQMNNKTSKTDDLNSKTRLNAHDIANRLMRKENYMIALFNKNILKKGLSVSIPILSNIISVESGNEMLVNENPTNNNNGSLISNSNSKSYFVTKTLEWNLKLCILDFLFNENGHIKQSVLNEHKRLNMSTELKKRFKLAGILSIFITPFLVAYFLLYYFLKFFYDFKTNPALMSSREYSPYARWKLREFNELPHIFKKRLSLSNESALTYINQFPKERSNITLKFISFVSGSLLTILIALTVLDPENFLNFELSEGRTVLFYMSVLTAIFTICKSGITETSNVFDPEASLRYVAQFTHYLPLSWEGRYHTEDVKNEFCELFNLRIILIIKEIMSLILLPYLLLFKLPNSSEKIIDFFREFSVHVDGLGYVCTFAMFKFDGDSNSMKDKPNVLYSKDRLKNGNMVRDHEDDQELLNEYYSTNDDKMVKSYLYFLESYGNEPIRQAPKKSANNHNGIHNTNPNRLSHRPRSNKMNKSTLLHSAIFNNIKSTGHNTNGSMMNSMYYRSEGPSDNIMEETTAGLNYPGGGGDNRSNMRMTSDPNSNSNDNYHQQHDEFMNDSLLLTGSYQVGYPSNALLKQDYENPALSKKKSKKKQSNRRGRNGNVVVEDDFSDGRNSDIEDDDDEDTGRGGGVLGMINQAYKRKDDIK